MTAMRRAAVALVGEHDFRAFRASDCERRTTRRIIRRLDVDRQGAVLTFEYTHADISGLGRSGRLHVGDTTWTLGLLLEF